MRKHAWRVCMLATAVLALCGPGRNTAQAARYVVDRNHPQAGDDNPGTEAAPWKTVQHAADIARAGDTVCVMEGVYDETLAPKNSGRPGAAIVFRGLPRHKAQLKGADTGKAAHVRIEGFRFAGEGVSVGGDHVWIVDNTFHDVRRTTVGGSGSNITVAYNRSTTPSCGVFASGKGWVVEANEIEHMVYQTGECDYARFFGKGHVFRRNFFHGTAQADVRKSHVDGFQTYNLKARAQLQAHDMTFLDNVVYNFHQGIIARSADSGFLSNFTIRGNIFAHGLLPNEKGAAVGLIFENVRGITVEHNLIADVQWFAFSPSKTTSGVLRNNIIYKAGNFDRGTRPENLKVSDNLIFQTKTKNLPQGAVAEADPMFIDPAVDHWRLRAGSPAIGAGTGESDIGPLPWPNVYHVDARHPGASDKGAGYSGRPFKTLAHAVSAAAAGETIVVHRGVYRETIAPRAEGLTIRAAEAEKVILSGADLVTGWARDPGDPDTWHTALSAKPARLLRDGQPFARFTWDGGAKRITVEGFDPRLHTIETVVRDYAVVLSAKKKVVIERIETANTLRQGVAESDG